MSNEIFQLQLKTTLRTYSRQIALIQGDRKVTYETLEANACRITRALLLTPGFSKGDFVGILCSNKQHIITAITGISCAGGVFVPLDTALPAIRILQMADTVSLPMVIVSREDSGVAAVIAQLQQQEIHIFYIEDMLQTEEREDNEFPEVAYHRNDALYIYFTSGSTGKPKAILGQNMSLHHFINWEINTFKVPPGARFSQLITPGFDAFLRDVFVPLFAGGIICIPENPQLVLQADTLSAWLNREEIQYIHCVPSIFRLISNAATIHSYPRLQYVFLSGERTVPATLKPWYALFGSRIQLVNFYGATETTLIKTYYEIKPADADSQNIPVGKPMEGARILVLDEQLNICDPLVPGEVFISTPYAAKGYYNEEALTRQKFMFDPYDPNPDGRIFKTGDKGRLLADGNLELLGRIDRQIKLRGVRIEPEEIETILLQHPSVKEAAVVTTIINDTVMLCACLAPVTDGTGGSEEILQYTRTCLPDYMVPGKIKWLSAFPRKVNGKLDYDQLVALLQPASEPVSQPLTALEQQLFDTWAGILKNNQFGADNTFFEVGGNSFHLIGLVAKVYSQFRVRLTIEEIFKYNSIRKLAFFLEGKMTQEVPDIKPAPVQDYYPLSAAQFRIYHQQQLQPEGTAYNLPQCFEIAGPVDMGKVEQAFRQMVQRHESLRTCFKMVEGEVVQQVLPEIDFRIDYQVSTESIPALISRFVRPFNLAEAPLLRVALVKRGPAQYLLMLDVHHVIADGLSQLLLNKEFSALYMDLPAALPVLQYKDFTVWQQQQRTNEVVQQQQQYWLKALANPPAVLSLPGEQTADHATGALHHFTIPRENYQRLKKMAKEKETTIFIWLLAVYNTLLSRLSGQDDIIVGTAASGRQHAALDKVIGMFVNTLALRNQLSPDMSFDTLLKQVHKNTLAALQHQDYPLEDIIQQLQLPRGKRHPLFSVMLVLQNMSVGSENIPGITITPYPIAESTSRFDLTLYGQDTGNDLVFRLAYASQRFSPARIQRLVDYFQEIITQVLSSPDIQLKDIHLSHQLETAVNQVEKISFRF